MLDMENDAMLATSLCLSRKFSPKAYGIYGRARTQASRRDEATRSGVLQYVGGVGLYPSLQANGWTDTVL